MVEVVNCWALELPWKLTSEWSGRNPTETEGPMVTGQSHSLSWSPGWNKKGTVS